MRFRACVTIEYQTALAWGTWFTESWCNCIK